MNSDWMIPPEVDRSIKGSLDRLAALADAYNSGWALMGGAHHAYGDVPGSTQTLRFDIEAVCRAATPSSKGPSQ